ncbi:MAG: tRNA (adenosine(37)-N6)-dimethylallyltransferase MiaA [Rickettsiella sp.]|nr:tRNA (adenosine(37)-N6)-dimethylallyltransferase MiaA [Rickettsiella sp.]
MDVKKPIVCLMGPTATGKTDLAIELIQQLPAEIISVDSAMIYREMNIGTAKPTPDILKQAPHRLIDIRDPSQAYSAGNFCEDVLVAIEDIFKKKHIPLLVGGTMLYFHVLQQGIAVLPKANPKLRQQLQQELKKQGLEKLYIRLKVIDPKTAQRIHPNDPQRILRALEVAEITGQTLTEIQQSQSCTSLSYQFINIALIPDDRGHHHQIIKNRFQNMLAQGFIEEVENLFERSDLNSDLPSIRTVGYRQIWRYLASELSHTEMQERAIIATRQLAKRQMTWLRSWKNLYMLSTNEKNKCKKFIEHIKRVS